MLEKLDWLVSKLTGEFLLEWYPNGGTVVLLRTLLTSSLLYAMVIALKCLLITGFGAGVDWALVRGQVLETLPWAGAIVAGMYTAFYSRFSSQWSYMANLYNQIMSTQAQAPRDGDDERERVYINWKAGVVEDAYVLHLAGKPMFAPLISELLEEPRVVAAFLDSAANAERALGKLEAQLTRSLGKTVSANRLPEASPHGQGEREADRDLG